MNKPDFYILTGGPGAGKTSVLNELRTRGYVCIPEVARNVIQEQVALNGDALPWGDRTKYAQLMLTSSIQDFIDNKQSVTPFFFDRGIPDTLAYCKLTGLELTEELIQYALSYRYNTTVFILPPWPEIYHTDDERKQDIQLAIDTYHQIKATYNELGYRLIQVPRLSVLQRADFILDYIETTVR